MPKRVRLEPRRASVPDGRRRTFINGKKLLVFESKKVALSPYYDTMAKCVTRHSGELRKVFSTGGRAIIARYLA